MTFEEKNYVFSKLAEDAGKQQFGNTVGAIAGTIGAGTTAAAIHGPTRRALFRGAGHVVNRGLPIITPFKLLYILQ